MTFNDFRRLIETNQDKCGVSGWCANCGGNLMQAPIYHTLKETKDSFDFCFSKCIHCGMKNPPLKMAKVFTEWEFHNCPTHKWSYYQK